MQAAWEQLHSYIDTHPPGASAPQTIQIKQKVRNVLLPSSSGKDAKISTAYSPYSLHFDLLFF
jgi:hypothetical protein